MRVLIVSHRFPPDAVAGVERYTESLAVELERGGDEVTVVSRRPGPGPVQLVREPNPAGVDTIRLAGGGVDRDRWLYLADALDARFEEILDEIRPETVHVNHLVDLSPRFPELARAAGAGVVLTVHDFWLPCPRITLQRPDGSLCSGPEGGRACVETCVSSPAAGPGMPDPWRLRALYLRRLLEIPDRLTCPSRYVADWFEGWGLEPGRMEPVPNGIEVPAGPLRRLAPRAGEDPLRLAILGAVVRHKGHHVVVDAIGRAGIEAELLVHGPVGDAGYLAELREAAETVPGLRLRVCGPYEPDDLSLLLEDVDALVAPSIWPETFCLVIREALVRGVPAITTRLGALPDAIDDGTDGFLYDHDDPDQLAALLGRLASEPGTRDLLRAGAAAARVPTLETHARRMRQIYREARDGRAARAAQAETAAHELRALEDLLNGEMDVTLNRRMGAA